VRRLHDVRGRILTARARSRRGLTSFSSDRRAAARQ
jgi:hypothetical protein